MLIILTWHQILQAPHAISPESFYNQLLFLKKNFPIKSKPISQSKEVEVLLTFDDATVDFAYNVYPLLVDLQIPATLAVPTGWIPPSSVIDPSMRLNLLNSKNPFLNREAFCSIQELKQMKNSDLITFAAHGHLHKNLKIDPDINELILPKDFFQKNLSIDLDTFIFPYGAFTQSILNQAKQNYPYLLRLGTACNFYRHPKLFYRIDINEKTTFNSIFTKKNITKLFLNETLNRIRNR